MYAGRKVRSGMGRVMTYSMRAVSLVLRVSTLSFAEVDGMVDGGFDVLAGL